MQVDAFMPTVSGTQTVSVGATSTQTAALAAGSLVEINNAGVLTVFVEQDPVNNNPVASVSSSYPVLAGQSKIFRRMTGVTKLALIGSAAGPTTVYVSTGEGV